VPAKYRRRSLYVDLSLIRSIKQRRYNLETTYITSGRIFIDSHPILPIFLVYIVLSISAVLWSDGAHF
jgi:hypothetical protein